MTDRKNDLRQMLDSLIDGNGQQAQVHFHQYLQSMMKGRVKDDKSNDQNSN